MRFLHLSGVIALDLDRRPFALWCDIRQDTILIGTLSSKEAGHGRFSTGFTCLDKRDKGRFPLTFRDDPLDFLSLLFHELDVIRAILVHSL